MPAGLLSLCSYYIMLARYVKRLNASEYLDNLTPFWGVDTPDPPHERGWTSGSAAK